MNNNLEKVLRNIALGALFLVPFVVLIVISGTFFPYITGKNFAFRILVEFATAIWAILLFINPSVYRPKKSYLLYAFCAFILIASASAIFGENPYKSFWSNYERMEGLLGLIHVGLYFVILSVFLNSEKLWNWFFTLSIVGAVYVSFYGLLQHFFGIGVSGQGGDRIDGTFGNAIYLAGYAMVHAVLAIFVLYKRQISSLRIILGGLTMLFFWTLFLSAKIPTIAGLRYVSLIELGIIFLLSVVYFWKKESILSFLVFLGGTSVLFSVTLYFTETRGAMLGLLSAVFLALILLVIKGEGKVRLLSAVFLTATLLTVSALYLSRESSFVKSHSALDRFTNISVNEGTGKARFMLWNMALEGFKEKPLLGWGQENFNFVFNKYYDPNMWAQEQWFDRAHSVFIDWLIATGILGLLAYLSFYIFAFYYLFKKRETFTTGETIILVALLLGNAVQSIFVFDNLGGYMTFAMILAYVHYKVGSLEKSVNTNIPPRTQGVIISAFVIIPIILFSSIYYFNLRPLYANRDLIKAISVQVSDNLAGNISYFRKVLGSNTFAVTETREQMLQALFSVAGDGRFTNEDKSSFLNLTAEEMRKQTEENPNDARYHFFLGALLRAFGRASDAVTYINKALELSPKKQSMRFELISAMVDLKQYDQAEKVAKDTLDLAPSYTAAKVIYAITLMYNNKIADLNKFMSLPENVDVILDGRTQAGYNANNLKDLYLNQLSINKKYLISKLGGHTISKADCNDLSILNSINIALGQKEQSVENAIRDVCR